MIVRDIDDMLGQALHEEERYLLQRIDERREFFPQLRESIGLVVALSMLGRSVLFLGGVWASWRFFQAGDVLSAVRCGLPAAVLLIASLVIWPGRSTLGRDTPG
jgi:hypothetical protein